MFEPMKIYVTVHSAVSSRSAEPWFTSFDVGLCLAPDQCMWDLWCKKWYFDTVFTN